MPGLVVPEDSVLESSDPAFAFLRVLGLEVEGLPVHGDGEGRVVLKSGSKRFNGSQTDAPSSFLLNRQDARNSFMSLGDDWTPQSKL